MVYIHLYIYIYKEEGINEYYRINGVLIEWFIN